MVVDVTYDSRLDVEAGYILSRMQTKINKVLKEFCKETFSSAFTIEPIEITEVKERKKNVRT